MYTNPLPMMMLAHVGVLIFGFIGAELVLNKRANERRRATKACERWGR